MASATSYTLNLKKINWHGFLSGFQPFVPILFIYLQGKGLSFTQLSLLISSFWAAGLLFDIPTGVFSDRFGRKPTLALSAIIFSASFALFYFGNSFPIFLLAYFLYGAAESFISGSDSAFIHDSLAQQGKTHEFSKWLGRKYAYFLYAAGISSLLASVFAPSAFKFTFLIALACSVASLFIISTLHEPKKLKGRAKHNYFQYLWNAIKFLSKEPKIWLLVLYFVVVNLTIQLFFPYLQFFLKNAGIPSNFNGALYALFICLSAFASGSGHILEKILKRSTLFLLIPLILAFSLFMLQTSSSSYLVVLLIVIIEIIFGINRPIITGVFHSYIDSSHRATLDSLKSTLLSISILILAPFFGHIADTQGIATTSAWLSVLILAGGLASGGLFLAQKKK